ncbi:MAG: VWA domain-containing protein [Myxococcota bacterium]
MTFTGVDPTTLLRAGAALGAVVVVFYILRLKRRPIAVPFSPLWERVLRDKQATTLFSQLKRLLSLLLQLALLALLLGALGDPRPALNEIEGRHVVVLFDASASMGATDGARPPEVAPAVPPERVDGQRTRLDVGRERIREVIRGLSGSDRMLIAQMDAAVTPLSTMTGDIAELEAALDRVDVRDARADYPRGLRFALDSLVGLGHPEILLVSDGALGDAVDGTDPIDLGAVRFSFVPVGSEGRNVAISEFSVRRYPLDKSRYEVLLEVTNTSDDPAEIDLELYGDGALNDIVGLTLSGGETALRFFPNLSGADQSIEARVTLKGEGPPDRLPADNSAYALLPERRRARVLVVTEGNMYLEAALLLDEYLEVNTVAPAGYPPASGTYDITIFDGVAPRVADGAGHRLYLDPPRDGDTPFEVADEITSTARYTVGFDEIEAKHPIVRGLTLGDVNIGRAHALRGRDQDTKVGASFKGTILLAGRRPGFKFAALGFDVRESDLPLRIAWPLLLLNTINAFVEEDTDYISSFRTGRVWRIPAPSELTTAILEAPGGVKQRVPVKDGRAYFLGQQAGFFRLLRPRDDDGDAGAPAAGATEGDADEELTRFAANLSDPFESAITPVPELAVGDTTAGPVSGFEAGVRREYWIYLLAFVLLVTAVEWWTYHRRITV